jgi:DNA repair ATPase RecN
LPRRIPDELRKRVIDLHRKGVNTEQIALKLGISEGSVHNIIHQERVVVPDYDEVRELGLSLRDQDITISQAKDGADLLRRINDQGISLETLSDAVDFYERQSPRPDELIALGKQLDNLARQYRRTPEQIIATAETLAKQLEPLSKNIEHLQNERAQECV